MRRWTLPYWIKELITDVGSAARFLSELYAHASFRAKLTLLGTLIGIPTSHYGWVWHEFKAVKPIVDCQTDVQTEVNTAFNQQFPHLNYSAQLNARLDAVNQTGKRFATCGQTIDPYVSSIDFIKQQHQRHQDGRS